ncbi:ATP-binding protein [Gulosibacter macacae]|uniref:ATP-binding protein n=1 Tax=Gulosibacter macacae TaxID=2488791 RepID=A0A3P3VTE8_9MICO|nr:YifB family Mg chelatase-like AAA ATPase [Gulosibacter macacae]RRJ86092.1 ATP-binding protein [Gulosibacter macacae]
MSGRVSRAWAIALEGFGGHPVEVETHIASGLPRFSLVGLPDAALNEAKDRIRAALNSSGQPLPLDAVTVNMSPASLRKHGAGFDLAIAVSILGAKGVITSDTPAHNVHLGELALTGAVRPMPNVLPAVSAARAAGFAKVLVPSHNANEARLVDGIDVVPITSIRDLALHYGAHDADFTIEPEPSVPFATATAESPAPVPELADVLGMDEAVRALMVAAAGRHHLLMVGPPGSGKTMLAERLAGILPRLEAEAAIEVAMMRSLRGLPIAVPLDLRPPFESPHHTASAAALVGGGSGMIKPGAVSLAAHGVLFLDEAPEFSRRVLDALRQPLESGLASVDRAGTSVTFPANTQLVLAANPCPCGNAGSAGLECTCRPAVQRSYLQRLSGPLLDRIDLQLRVDRPSASVARLAAAGERGAFSTADAAARVLEARARAAQRLRGTGWTTNSEVDGNWLRRSANRPELGATAALDTALERGRVTMRGYTRCLRVAWTLADLDGAARPNTAHIGEALWYRVREQG